MKKVDDQKAFDDVLRRMLATPPEPHVPPKATKAKSKPKKKPAK